MTTICSRPTTVRIPSRTSSNSNAPSSHSLALNTSFHGSPAAVPNKHIPFCSPGPQPSPHHRQTSTTSPPPNNVASHSDSLLFPPHTYTMLSDRPSVYLLDSDQLHAALEYHASRPLPDPRLVFPWLHGLHPDNTLQLTFFTTRRRAQRRPPHSFRSITIVKARGNLSHSKLKGAVDPREILEPSNPYNPDPGFLQCDPKQGFSVRNFHIQTAKIATLSDIVVYGDANTKREDVRLLAVQLARAQRKWRDANKGFGVDLPKYHTFMLQDPFAQLEKKHPDIVAIGSNGHATDNVIDFLHCERQEMHEMSAPTEISHNVWLGPSTDASFVRHVGAGHKTPQRFDLLIEAIEGAPVPTPKSFRVLDTLLNASVKPKQAVPQLQFLGSGSVVPSAWSQPEVDSVMSTCEWLYRQANGLAADQDASSDTADAARNRKGSRVDSANDADDGSAPLFDPEDLASTSSEVVVSSPGRSVLLHCADGYTETTLLAVAFYMYANCVPLHTAYIELHKHHKRNFFAYATDLALLTLLQPRLLQASPAANFSPAVSDLNPPEPAWMSKCDGSLPSRITEYMYLGNVAHANNPGLLNELGIGQVLSVGEPVTWTEEESVSFSKSLLAAGPTGQDVSRRLLYIDKVQDNGIDSLTDEIPKCLKFIERGRKAGIATLVHCRVGVSRSATICIAEVMREHNLSFPKAYCYVRARRLNVIIQPHLRFGYELLKYEETLASQRGRSLRRDLEWSTVAREIAALNKPYCRQQ